MTTPKFQVGDRVRIRDWVELYSEYYSPHHRCIVDKDVCFVEEMKYMCGLESEILDVKDIGYRVIYIIDEKIQQGWTITEYMLELVEEDTDLNDINPDDFMSLI
jgi:hypothetical protein